MRSRRTVDMGGIAMAPDQAMPGLWAKSGHAFLSSSSDASWVSLMGREAATRIPMFNSLQHMV